MTDQRLKIVSWNVNSIGPRLSHLQKLVEDYNPNVILLQEIKCMDEKFPREAIEDLGYNVYTYGQKSYNGVAILSKSPVEDIKIGLYPEDEQARYIEGYVQFNNEMIKVASVYIPNGSEPSSDKFVYKMTFFEELKKHIQQQVANDEKYVLGGDLNVAPENLDVYDPKYLDGKIGFHIEERRHFRRLIAQGMHDSFRLLNPQSQEFSWWDYRTRGYDNGRGMRIDHILTSSNVISHLTKSGILCSYRGLERPSDHAPIYIELSEKAT